MTRQKCEMYISFGFRVPLTATVSQGKYVRLWVGRLVLFGFWVLFGFGLVFFLLVGVALNLRRVVSFVFTLGCLLQLWVVQYWQEYLLFVPADT